ncbi:sulfatase [Nocardioides sp. BP30]|uniref:sulfatase family protein n=1 Tax=Nocardioides sp. BP30 TaxID=3036374 RepID=UPI002468D3C4|nr:sulfatase [Nocardioides sp. BP30]WGL51762.1 sulfatase [Nocardioides sp. BP30]
MTPRTTLAVLAVGALAALSGIAHVPGAASAGSTTVSPTGSQAGGLAGGIGPVTQASHPSLLPRTATPVPPLRGFPRRPNILMITADDLSELDLPFMPHVRHLMAQQGVTLSEAEAPTPICVPARASLLSGQYAHNDGARTISGPHGGYHSFDEHGTVATSLRAAGYDTLFTGKFLNGYGEHGTAHQVPPGWSDWRATIDPTTYGFFNPTFDLNGRLEHSHGYSTTVISRQANAMLRSPARATRPWFAWVNYVAPHFGGPIEPGDPRRIFRGTSAAIPTTVPAPRDRGRFAAMPLPHRPDLFEAKRYRRLLPKNSPGRRKVTPKLRRALRMAYDQRLEAVQGVDRAVAAQLRVLRRSGQLDDTMVIFASDNGYATGEHNINGKLWHYDEIVRIPMLIRGPGVPRDTTVATPVTNPDVAATIIAAAGARPQRTLDGVDIRPWLSAPAQERVVPIEGWPVTNGDRRLYSGVRFGSYTYVRLRHGREELYDRSSDPYELRNLAKVPAARHVLEQLRALDARYRDCRGGSCPTAFYPAT